VRTLGAAALVVATLPLVPANAASAPRLPELLRRASTVGIARIAAIEEIDHGRIRVYDVAVEKELKPGKAESPRTVRVVSMADQPGAVVADADANGVAFLQPLRRNSYLDKHLATPHGLYEFVDGRDGWLQATDAGALAAIAAPVEATVEQSRAPTADAAARSQRRRAVVFALLSAPHPLLAEDGIAGLSSIAGLSGSLNEQESGVIAAALSSSVLPLSSRERLIGEIAELDLKKLIGALQELKEPELQRPVWAALRKLGAPVSQDALRDRLKSDEPLVRSAAAREMLAAQPSEAIPEVATTVLRDRDQQVRLDAIEALGETRLSEAVPPLEGVFVRENLDERQAAARALREIGGDVAADALHRLAFVGSAESQRYAVVILMSLGVGNDDRRVRDIAKRHTDEKIADMLEHGFEAGHGH